MQKDKGQTKIITDTGQKVTTTGLMLDIRGNEWQLEVKYKNGKKAWFYDYELQDFPDSK